MKKKIIIIGSGLAAITASKFLVEKGIKVTLISSNNKNHNIADTQHLFSARLKKNFININKQFISDYNILVKNFSIIGSNALGGLSNFWGGGFFINKDYLEKYKIKSYYDVINKNFKLSKINNKQNEFTNFLISFSNNVIKFSHPCFFEGNKKDKFYSSLDDLKKLNKNKNFTLLSDNLVTKITRSKNNNYNIYVNNEKKRFLSSEAIVLASGTIGTTKLLLQYFSLFDYKVRVKHNPQIAILGFLRKKFLNKNKNITANILYSLKNKKNLSYDAGMIGLVSEDVVDVICKRFKYIPSFIFKFFFKIFKDRIFIGNFFISNHFSDSYLSLNKNNLEIQGNYKAKYFEYEKIIKRKIKNNFSKFSLYTFFYRLPIGSDIHYTGTINSKNHIFFKVNDDYSLDKNPNMFVIDGAVIKGNPIYPGFYIINNAIDFCDKYLKSK